MSQRSHRVVIPGTPVLLHRETREFVVLRLPFVVLGAIVTARAPEVDLECERVLARSVLDHPVKRCVREETTVPVVFALDFDRRKAWRQRTAGHDMLRSDLTRCIVEID